MRMGRRQACAAATQAGASVCCMLLTPAHAAGHSKPAPEDAPALLQDANLWDVTLAPTIVMTQRGVRRAFQEQLRSLGVEVVQFDFLTPDAVALYCSARGFLQCLWECGGTLAAPAIACQTVHKAMAFIAPKLVRPAWTAAAGCGWLWRECMA